MASPIIIRRRVEIDPDAARLRCSSSFAVEEA